MIVKRDLWLVGILGALAVNLVVALHFYSAGKQAVALGATKDSLAVVRKEKAVIQKQRDSIGAELKIAAARSEQTRTVYIASKGESQIKGDSAFDEKGKFIQILDPRIVKRIDDADAHVTSLEAELRTAKSALRVDTVFIAKQAEETKLNERIADMVSGPKCGRKCGIVIGVAGTIAAAKVASLILK